MDKPHKVEETQGVYAPSPKRVRKVHSDQKAGPRYLERERAEEIADKLMTERRELLRKLAQ